MLLKMRVPVPTFILFLFCALTSLNCILGSEEEVRFAENMRKDFGKKSITEEDKKVELLTPEPVEQLLYKSAVAERKKSSFRSFNKKEVPNCYLKKWTSVKTSIRHDLFSKKDIQIPKIKGIYEEHDVQFLFIEADPKRIPMMKCSCQIIFFDDNLEDIDSVNSSLERGSNRHLPSRGEIKDKEITMDLGSPAFNGVNENRNEVRPPVPSQVSPIQNYQISRHDYNEANFTSDVHITEHKQQISSRKQEEESTGIQKPNKAVDIRTEVHIRDNDDSSLEDEKDLKSTPTSPKDPKGGFIVNLKDKFKRLWPWGRSKTDEEIHNDEHHASNLGSDAHKITDEKESPQKTVEDKFETTSGREKLRMTTIENEENREHFLSSQKYRNHEHSTLLRKSSQSNDSDSKGKRPEEITTTGKYLTEQHSSLGEHNYRTVNDFRGENEYSEKLDSHNSIREHELLSAKTRNRSSAREKETLKISGSMSVVGKEGNESLSTSTKSSHQINQAYTHKHLSNEKLNDSGQVTAKSVIVANRVDDQQNTGSNTPNAGQGIMGSIVGSVGGLLGRFSGQTKIEDKKEDYNKGKRSEEITTTGKYLTEHNSSLGEHNYRTVNDFHGENEYSEKLDSHNSIREHELLSAKTRNRSSAEEKETLKISGSMSVVGKERNESLSTSTKSSHQINQAYTHKHLSNEKLNDSGQVTAKSVIDANRVDDQQNTGSNPPNAGQGIMGSIVGGLGGLLGRFSGQTKIEDAKAKDSSSSEEDGEDTNGKLIIVPPKIIKSEQTIHMGNALERRADALQEGDLTIAHKIEALHEDVRERDSKEAELNYKIVEYSHQKTKNELPNEEGGEKSYNEEVIRLQTRVPANNNVGEFDQLPSHHEKLIERKNSQSSSQEDEKYEQLGDRLVGVERVHQQENNNKKETLEHLDGELTMLSQSGKEIEEIPKNVDNSHTASETVLKIEHLDEHTYLKKDDDFEKVSEIKGENKIAVDLSSNSSSSSSSESEDKGNGKKKLKKRNEDIPKKQSGEELDDAESRKEKEAQMVGEEYPRHENVIEKEVGNVVGTEYGDIFTPDGNTAQGESKFHQKWQQEGEGPDGKTEIGRISESDRTMYEQTIKVKSLESTSSDEMFIQREELELMEKEVQSPRQAETIFQIEAAKEGENSNHHLKYEEKLRENVEHFDETNNPLRIENDWHKQEESTKIESSLVESQYQQKYVKKVRVEEDQSDSSSASNDEKQTYPEKRVVLETNGVDSNNNGDKDKSEENTNNQLFRRSPDEYTLPRSSTKKIKVEKKYKYASEIPSESICVQEDGGQFLYLSKGHLKDKSFFVYRKTRQNKFHVIAYIILR